jgi:hypothetical protein
MKMKEEIELKVECKICGKKFKAISKHVCQAHKMKAEEYYLKFINPKKGKCIACGKDTHFSSLRVGYLKFCSTKCSANNSETRQKCKETYIKKTGFSYASQNPEVQKKARKTNLKNCGFEYPIQSPKVKEKTRKTNLKNCGFEYSFQSPEFQQKSKETNMKNLGVENSMQSKKVKEKQQESILKNNNGIHHRKLTYKHVQERYPDVVKIEELIEGPNGEIWGHCKNANCKNSRENGGYFDVSKFVGDRNDGINKHDTGHFYCSEECKHTCPLYGRSAAQLHNLINENPEIPYTPEEYNTWKEEVYHRQKIENNTDTNFCEKCQATENLHVHHIQPQKLEPGYALDPINGIVFCEDCHYKIGHAVGTECSTGNLAAKICK